MKDAKMSMNLHCTEIELRQTPTQITFMCMVQPDGTIANELTGRKAQHAIQIYKQWVQYIRNGIVCNDPQDLQELITLDNEHLLAIDEATKNKKIKVWWT